MTGANKMIAVIAGVVILGGVGWNLRGRSLEKKKVQSEVTQLVEGARGSLETMRSGYAERTAMIQQLLQQKVFPGPEAEELSRKIQYLSNAKLESQTDFNQYDQLQNDLSNKLAEHLIRIGKSSPASGASWRDLFRQIEGIERSIEKSRVDYVQSALKVNARLQKHADLRAQFGEMPVFQATAQSLRMQASQTTTTN